MGESFAAASVISIISNGLKPESATAMIEHLSLFLYTVGSVSFFVGTLLLWFK